MTDNLIFDAALHVGTLLAVVVFFVSDISRLFIAWLKSIVEWKIGNDSDRRMAWYLFVATVPGGIAGMFFEQKIQVYFHDAPIPQLSMILMAIGIAILGVLMWLAETLSRHEHDLGKLLIWDSLLIGLAQALAIFPGVSRSGALSLRALLSVLNENQQRGFSYCCLSP